MFVELAWEDEEEEEDYYYVSKSVPTVLTYALTTEAYRLRSILLILTWMSCSIALAGLSMFLFWSTLPSTFLSVVGHLGEMARELLRILFAKAFNRVASPTCNCRYSLMANPMAMRLCTVADVSLVIRPVNALYTNVLSSKEEEELSRLMLRSSSSCFILCINSAKYYSWLHSSLLFVSLTLSLLLQTLISS